MTAVDGTGHPGETLRVLIVDDNVDMSLMLAELVTQWGYDAKVAHTAAAAFELARGYRPRVVLVDLGLPDEHGYQLARRLRQDAGTRPMTFVAITGWAQIADQTQSSAASVSHHLVKPLNHEALRAILDGYRASTERRLAKR